MNKMFVAIACLLLIGTMPMSAVAADGAPSDGK
jgi:hypothetical protein